MNRTDLINAIASEANLKKADAANALNAVLGAISTALQNGDKVSLVGFGTFSVAEKAARKGVNPRTGESIEIPASKNVKFKAGAELAEKVK